MLALRVEGLKAALGHNLILNDVNFMVQAGELAALVGGNGAGKTTLLRILAGILQPLAGVVEIFGRPLTSIDGKTLSYLPQKSSFDSTFPLRVNDVVQLGWGSWSFFHRPGRKKRERVDWCLQQVGLTGLGGRPIGELSGGQQQLVFLARSIYGNPRMLLLDEPTTGLDMVARQRFYQLLKELKNKLGLTILIVTHDLEAVFAHADRVILLEEQRITHQGSPEKIRDALEGLSREKSKRGCLRVVD